MHFTITVMLKIALLQRIANARNLTNKFVAIYIVSIELRQSEDGGIVCHSYSSGIQWLSSD